MAPGGEATPEMPIPSPRVSAQAQGRWADEPAPVQQQPEHGPIPHRVPNAGSPPVHSTLEEASAFILAPGPGIEESDVDLVSAPKTGHPLRRQAIVEPVTPPLLTTRGKPRVQEVFEQEAVTKVQPVTPHPMATSPPVIKPAPIQSQLPTFPASEKPAGTQAEPRPIQVRIGTIEVRATTPPPPAPPPTPAPQGFGDYVLLRNYVNWGQY